MKRKGTIWLVVVLLAIGAIIYLLVQPVFYYSRPQWPPISDSATLRADAEALSRQYTSVTSVPRNAWPQSIRDLRPVGVAVFNGHILITISGGGIGAAHGYVVYPYADNVAAADNGLRHLGRVAPHIYRFETVE